MNKLSRSWQLAKSSAAVVADNKQLLVLPVISGIAGALVIATFVIPIVSSGVLDAEADRQTIAYVWMFLLYVALYFVGIFFNTALVSIVLERLDGRQASLRDGLRIAFSRIGAIAGYAVIAATVGVLLRAIEERVGLIGRLVTAVIGTAWSVATFLVAPILAVEKVGAVQAVRDSATLLKQTWGENIAGNVGIAFVFGLGYLLLIVATIVAVVALANLDFATLAIAVAIAACFVGVGLAVGQAALQGVYSALLYRYAHSGEVPVGFDRGALDNAFRRK